METELLSIFIISVTAFVCPLLASLIPNQLIPDTVLLLIAGMIFGPNVLGVIDTGNAGDLLSDIGLGFLFLLAGYEIKPTELTGKLGRDGLITWIATFGIAVGVIFLSPVLQNNLIGKFAVAIALTTTAFGTLVPILASRGLSKSRIGACVTAYGSWGELCPIIAISLLLSTRATWLTAIILLAFAAIAVISALLSRRFQSEDTKIGQFITSHSEASTQMNVRAVVMLLIGLVTISALFGLDIVLGAFAAGFVLRSVLPKGDANLEHKLNGLGYGFFIPLFFVMSGANINPSSVIANPALLALFIIMLVLIRAVPIYISLSLSSQTKDLDTRERATVALYCTTALPLIVAVTTVAVSADALSSESASLLVAAGGITVLIMPLFASITLHTLDADLGTAINSIKKNPKNAYAILREHQQLERARRRTRPHVLSRTNNRHIKQPK